MAYLRQPIISVLGHVDHGKTSLLDYIRHSKICAKEAGGITQHIGATEVPREELLEFVSGFIPKDKLKIPGLLFIDTPGHKAFTSLRKRGGSICDIGILVVDINEGFKPQTIEAIEILKSMKVPFVIAANKVDAVSGFVEFKDCAKLLDLVSRQRQDVVYRIEEKVYEIVGKLSEFGYDSDRFDRIEDFTKKVAIVPISALKGFGIRELISTLVGLTQKFMEKKLTIENEEISRGVVLEVKDYPGLGKTLDVIVYDGVVSCGDTALVLDVDSNVLQSRVKSILKPAELKEIRDSATKFAVCQSVSAACGVKFACPDFVDVKAGMPIVTLKKGSKQEVIDFYSEKLKKENVISNLSLKSEGVLVKADTLGSLEAISHILEEHQIPLRKAVIGKISKSDIIDASGDVVNNPKNALILNFSQKVEDDILAMAKEYKVTVVSNDIIYALVDDAKAWIVAKENELLRAKMAELTLPFKVRILRNCIFRASNPAIVGVEVLGGTAKKEVVLMTEEGKRVGTLKSIKNNQDTLEELKFNGTAAISVDNLIVGRHAQEDSVLYSFMPESNFRNLKKNIELLSKDEVNTLREIAEIMRKEDTLWGL